MQYEGNFVERNDKDFSRQNTFKFSIFQVFKVEINQNTRKKLQRKLLMESVKEIKFKNKENRRKRFEIDKNLEKEI